MTKKTQKKTEIQKLNQKLTELMNKRLKAYSLNMSGDIISQLDNMIEEVQLDLHTAIEIEKHHTQNKDEDGESFIV